MRTISISKIILSIIILSSSCLFAQSDNVNEVYNKVLARYDKMTSFTAKFSQNNYWKRQNADINSEGWVYVEGKKAAVIYNEPKGQKVLYDDAYYVIDDVNRTVLIASEKQPNNLISPTDVIKSFWKGSEAKVSRKTNEIIELTLVPTKDENIAKVVAVISAKDYLIESLAYEDHQGNKITLTFKYSDIGKPVDKVIFKKHWNNEYTIIN